MASVAPGSGTGVLTRVPTGATLDADLAVTHVYVTRERREPASKSMATRVIRSAALRITRAGSNHRCR